MNRRVTLKELGALIVFGGAALVLLFIMGGFALFILLLAALYLVLHVFGVPIKITKNGEVVGQIRRFKYYPKDPS